MNQQKRLYGLGINALNPSDFLMMNLSPRNMWGQSINFNMVSSRPMALFLYIPSPDAGIRILSLGIVASVLAYISFLIKF